MCTNTEDEQREKKYLSWKAEEEPKDKEVENDNEEQMFGVSRDSALFVLIFLRAYPPVPTFCFFL